MDMKKIILLMVLSLVITACSKEESSSSGEPSYTASSADIEACISRGIAYFKEVGAYPTLTTTGENAETVAKERCNRTTTAF